MGHPVSPARAPGYFGTAAEFTAILDGFLRRYASQIESLVCEVNTLRKSRLQYEIVRAEIRVANLWGCLGRRLLIGHSLRSWRRRDTPRFGDDNNDDGPENDGRIGAKENRNAHLSLEEISMGLGCSRPALICPSAVA